MSEFSGNITPPDPISCNVCASLPAVIPILFFSASFFAFLLNLEKMHLALNASMQSTFFSISLSGFRLLNLR